MATLVDELNDVLDEAAEKYGIAVPGDVHARADGDYEKQRDGTWKRLPSGHGKKIAHTTAARKKKQHLAQGASAGAGGASAPPTVSSMASEPVPPMPSEPSSDPKAQRTRARMSNAAASFSRVVGMTSPTVRDVRHPATVKGVGWIPGAGPWKDKAEGLPESTWKANFDTDKQSPTYNTPTSDERKKLHASIYEAFLDATPRVPDDQQPVAIVTMGLPASGKSSAIQALAIDSSQFVPADADLVKNYIPEFQQGLDQRAKNSAHIVHDESAYLVEQMREKAMKDRKCMVADGTGSNFDVWEKLIKDLKQNGYRVHLLMADLPPDKCKERIKDRAERTGRYVPPHVVDDLAPKIQSNFMKLKDLSDTAMLFSTEDVDDAGVPVPKPIYTRIDDSPEEIDDEELYTGFKKKAGVSEAMLAALGVRRTLREAVSPLRGKTQTKPPFVADDAVVAALALGLSSEAATYATLPVRFAQGEGVVMLASADEAL